MNAAETLSITLEDKYTHSSGRVFLTGSQALVRLPLLQRQRDAAAGLNTAGFVSGYRGSPLGGVDQAFWAAKRFLEPQHIVFQPGVNEDLAATAVWGTQQVDLFAGARYDGVFGMWYGKGPGVDRCGDVFRHANAAGSSRYGGVLVIAGDDHNAKSSTLPHQTDHFFKAVMMPVLYPANVQEYLDFGLHGWAMSRYSGCWVALKALADTVETSASVDIDPLALQIVTPTDFELPEGGLNIRWPDDRHEQERRLLHFKLYAALAYARANRLNRVVIDSPDSGTPARLGIITAGKSYLDVRQAFDELGIDDALAAEIGIRLYKVGMVWPLEAEGVRHFAEGLEEILVVEEKRQLIEYQLKEELYNWREDVRPRVIGKFDEKGEWSSMPDARGFVSHGEWLLPAAGELSVAQIARVIAGRIDRFFTSARIAERLALIDAKQHALAAPILLAQRTPTFCSGCPHNTSTRVPEGSRAVAGIGCHYMVTWMDRSTATFTHMGGEGVPWVGQAPFTDEKHIFANLGDGTYFHSGLLAIRQAVAAFNKDLPPAPLPAEGGDRGSLRSGANEGAALGRPGGHPGITCDTSAPLPAEGGDRGSLRSGANEGAALGRPGGHPGITYKILYNDAVAMTGGQPVDGTLTVPQMTRQLDGEGVRRIVIVTDEPEKYAKVSDLARPGGAAIPIRHRDELDAVQRELREYPGVSVLIYDQTCATEKRRRRKRGKLADPARRVFINEAVCEGCGDCGVQSNCLAIVPVETGFGRKRQIDQSACNKDFSCLKGFCPSFVTIEGGQLRKPKAMAADEAIERHFAKLPMPALAATEKPFNILVTGVGGTGVVTIGALIGIAAHIDGKGISVLDMTGLAQKFGAVHSHLRIADKPADIHAARIATGEADAIIGGDLVVSAGNEAISKTLAGKTRAVVNVAETPTAEFTRNPDWQFPLARMERRIAESCGETGDLSNVLFLDAQALAQKLIGDAIFANTFLLGVAWQQGLVPVSLAALDKAFELNGTAVDNNRRAFLWGRRAACDLAAVRRFARADDQAALPQSLDDMIAERVAILADYQDAAYGERYRQLVGRVRAAAAPLGGSALTEAVARYYFKLLAIKDEYEVARLFADPAFLQKIDDRFAGDYRLNFHLAPPLLAKTDANTGHPQKKVFGPWMLRAFGLLAKLRCLRGGMFDIFGRTAERRLERQLIADYEADIALLLERLDADTLADAVKLAALPEQIRGFGHVKAASLAKVRPQRDTLRARLERASAETAKAAEATEATAAAAA